MEIMRLNAEVCGIRETCLLNITLKEWGLLSVEQQRDIVREYLSNVAEVWVDTCEDETSGE